MIAAQPLIALCFYLVSTFLDNQAYKIEGKADPNSKIVYYLGLTSSIFLAISVAAMSDGKTNGKNDMNWTIHDIGATGFFAI